MYHDILLPNFWIFIFIHYAIFLPQNAGYTNLFLECFREYKNKILSKSLYNYLQRTRIYFNLIEIKLLKLSETFFLYYLLLTKIAPNNLKKKSQPFITKNFGKWLNVRPIGLLDFYSKRPTTFCACVHICLHYHLFPLIFKMYFIMTFMFTLPILGYYSSVIIL